MAGHRKAWMVTVITVAAIVAIVLTARALVNVDRYRLRVISYLKERTGKSAEIGKLSLSFFPLAIHVDNFGLRNAPPFPPGYIVKAAGIEAELDFRALLHRHLLIHALVLDHPEVNPTSDPDGPWNFENPNAKPSAKPITLGEIGRVQIRRGQLVASNLLPSNAPGPVFFEAHEIYGELDHVNVDAMIDPNSSSMGGQGHVRAEMLSLG